MNRVLDIMKNESCNNFKDLYFGAVWLFVSFMPALWIVKTCSDKVSELITYFKHYEKKLSYNLCDINIHIN